MEKNCVDFACKYQDVIFWLCYILAIYLYTAYLMNKEKKTGEKNWWILRGIELYKKTK
jgi:hypothetical protein